MEDHGALELVQCFVFAAALSEPEKKVEDAFLMKSINKRRSLMTLEDGLRLTLMQLRFQIEEL